VAAAKSAPEQTAPGPEQTDVALPEITVGKFEDAAKLVEELVQEKASVFVDALARYRNTHRDGMLRPLNALEAAQITSAMAEALSDEQKADLAGTAAEIQDSGLRAYDEPGEKEVLLAAGLSTAPAFMDAARRLVALIEMPDDLYEAACTDGRLFEAIREAADELRKLPLAKGRERASRALGHFSETAGVDSSGKAWAHIGRIVLTALTQAVGASFSTSSTSSLVDTTGASETSDSEPPTETPSS
jgi:hypothetical protein